MNGAQVQDQAISRAFVAARRAARALAQYPGLVPETPDEAYAVQDRSIAAWHEEVAGWKIGLIAPALREKFGAARIAGPIFAPRIQIYRPGSVAKAAFIPGGFGALEAEFVLRLSADIAASAPIVTDDALARFVGAMQLSERGTPWVEKELKK